MHLCYLCHANHLIKGFRELYHEIFVLCMWWIPTFPIAFFLPDMLLLFMTIKMFEKLGFALVLIYIMDLQCLHFALSMVSAVLLQISRVLAIEVRNS